MVNKDCKRMSIPPLVCSTPPPPEQCEDDKDPDEFDSQYNLSQEDYEDNEFRYGNFTNLNTVHSCATDSNSSSVLPKDKLDNNAICTDVANHKLNIESPHIVLDEKLNHSSKILLEEDLNIEDLNLNVNNESTSPKENLENNELESHSKGVIVNSSKDLQSDIPCTSSDFSQVDSKISLFEEYKSSDLSLDNHQVLEEITEELSNEVNLENNKCDSNLDYVEKTDHPNLKESSCDIEDDFNEFQFISSDQKQDIVIDTNDPWMNRNTDDVTFGDFTANFGDNSSTLAKACTEEPWCTNFSPDTNLQTKNFHIKDCDDDFGDFDEFKCSSLEDKGINHAQNITSDTDSVPVLNFQSENEHQLIESINKVLHTIFQEEITESENEYCSNLDTTLGETWRHLKDTDNRQPYMVNWNNSLAQKTLLKALCIDSRNILFGPKWSSNMPKYAVNLNTPPLLPQKQVTQVNLHNEQTSFTNKSVNKATWADPFTSDGQESCNVDSENTTIEAGPTDLDVFEATMASKVEKIYSSTLNIQPIRQINLPDTHIFTPTDSETPRSKTIHYDTTHTILIPEPVTSVNTQMESNSAPTTNTSNSESDEYWEFQNFKGSTDNKLPLNQNIQNKSMEKVAINDAHIRTEYTYETQVLQPIKLEPTMPTLNWPDPGEVKETFEDFTDFISKSALDIEKATPLNNYQDGVLNIEKQSTNEGKVYEAESQKSGQQHDDFDMFQSALPTATNLSQLDNNKLGKCLENQNIPNFDAVFSKLEHDESDDISLTQNRPFENIKLHAGNLSKVDDSMIPAPSNEKSSNDSNLLQPMPLLSTVAQNNQQNTGQILQPLSLESYSQINWPNPGIDLHDLSRFNPVESLYSFKSDSNNHSKNSSPIHNTKSLTNSQAPDEIIWGEFVSSFPKSQQPLPKKQTTFVDDDEWTDFVSSPSVNTQNGLNTISLNVHTNFNIQKSHSSSKYPIKNNEIQLDIPTLNYITPKTNSQKTYNERHFQNL